jgi:hypothetical protein
MSMLNALSIMFYKLHSPCIWETWRMNLAEKEYFVWRGQRANELLPVAAKGDGVLE